MVLAISSVHTYAFISSWINYQNFKSELGKMVVFLNGFSSLHGLTQFAIFLPFGRDLKFALTQFVFMETYLILIFYIKTICIYMQLKMRALKVLLNVLYFSLTMVFMVFCYWLVTGKSLIFEQTMLETDNIMYNINDFPITPNVTTSLFIGVGMLGFTLFCLQAMYRLITGPRTDYFLVTGMIGSIIANMNDASIIYGNFRYAVPLFVVSNFIECGRMTYVAQRITFLRFSESNALANSVRRIIHDIRRPFSYIRIFLLNLSRQLKGRDDAILNKFRDLKHNLDKSHHEVETMLGELLDIGREINVHKISFSLQDLIADCLERFFVLEERKDWSTSVSLNHTSSIYADREKIKRVLDNLISNAIKQAWLPEGFQKKLTIESGSGTKSFWIKVTNTGSCVESDRVNTIFSQFYTRNNIGGKGIGLAICKKYIDLHDGTIRCLSDKDKMQTSFLIDIPLPSPSD